MAFSRRDQRLAAALAYAATMFSSAGSLAGTVIHINGATGYDGWTGQNWTSAKRTVGAGLAAAVSGDQVWVAGGTYVERITLKDGVELYGGFAGHETQLAQRDWIANRTILDGNRYGTVVTAPSGATATTRIDGFAICNGAATSSGGGILCQSSSPTIANNAITRNTASYEGGGIYCGSSSATIANNTITGNAATYGGGGILCESSSPTIANNTITGNAATYPGGGVFCSFSSPTIVNTIIAFNSSGIYSTGTGTATLRYNCVYGNGTGAYNYSGMIDPTGTDGNLSADPKVADRQYGNWHIQPDSPCVDAGSNGVVQPGWTDVDGQPRIQGAHVDIGADESDGTTWPQGPNVIVRVSPGGNDANNGSSWALAKLTVQAGIDAASALGGEVWAKAGTYPQRITLRPFAYVYGGFSGVETGMDLRNFRTNITILDGQQGGTVVTVRNVAPGLATINGFTIRNGRTSGYGGGISCSGASPTIANNTITGNTAIDSGGGIYCESSSPTIANNTITRNTATRTAADAGGGGIFCYNSTPMIANNTITGNKAYSGGGGILCYNASPTIANTIIAFNLSSGLRSYGTGAPTLRYNCVYGNGTGVSNYSGMTDPTGTHGNISADPEVAGWKYGNCQHIQPDSPCVDAGTNGVVQPGWIDVDGQPRIHGGRVDIGADESDGTIWPEGPNVIVRVSPGGNDANDGSSWALAKSKVQAGIDAASALGGEVWVKAGTYPQRITLPPFTHVYGGFSGAETDREQRDFRTNITILDGQQGGSVVTVQGLAPGLATIDGFTIRNGRASSYGGGILCGWLSSPTIANNTITANAATSRGGGIYCGDFSSPTIANNTITGSTASAGGGIYCYSSSSATIANNMITGNTATAAANPSGGGIFCYSSSPTIASNTITGNTASSNGGGIYCYLSSPTISNNTVAFNSSGIYKSSDSGTPTLRNNCVYNPNGYNYSGVTPGAGDISVDPLFVDRAGGDYHLTAASPCIDAGYDGAVQPGWTDMDGQPRSIDDPWVSLPGRGPVDIGADEYARSDFDFDGDVDIDDYGFLAACFTGPLVLDPADYDGDGDVDLDDFVAWAGCMVGPGTAPGAGCSAMDLDGDGDVDLGDFAEFQVSHTGPDAFLPPACRPADLDADNDVDVNDFAVFQTAFTG